MDKHPFYPPTLCTFNCLDEQFCSPSMNCCLLVVFALLLFPFCCKATSAISFTRVLLKGRACKIFLFSHSCHIIRAPNPPRQNTHLHSTQYMSDESAVLLKDVVLPDSCFVIHAGWKTPKGFEIRNKNCCDTFIWSFEGQNTEARPMRMTSMVQRVC